MFSLIAQKERLYRNIIRVQLFESCSAILAKLNQETTLNQFFKWINLWQKLISHNA